MSRNPVSLRIYKILGTNYNDAQTRQALETLSGLAHDPKHVKRDMHQLLSVGSKQFLDALSQVDQKLEQLQQSVNKMRQDCDQAESQLQLTTEASKTLLEHADSLRQQRNEVEAKKTIVSLFLSRFTLTDDQVDALTSRDVPIGPRFFEAMTKTEQIRDDCQVLMAGENGPTPIGLDIMAATASHLERGYEKILRWCAHEFRTLSDSHLEASPTMQECIRRLRKRPELLTEALTTLAQTRQASLLAAFVQALTRGGPSGLPRPIELHAHDPIRYIGDMLAWIHQSIAAEREFYEGLFSYEPSSTRIIGSTHEQTDEWIGELLDSSVGKVCVPLKSRVLQTVTSQESIMTRFRVSGLVRFYWLTMKRTVGEDTVLTQTLKEMMDVAFKLFYEAIQAQGRALLRTTLDVNDHSVAPAQPILEHAQIIRDIANAYQSFADDEDPEGFERISDVAVDPALEFCVMAGENKQAQRPQWDVKVFVLNCLTYLQTVLEPYEFAERKRHTIQGVVEGRVAELVEEHYENIMTDAGLLELANIMFVQKPQEPLAYYPSTQPAQLRQALSQFSQWLSSDEVVHSPRLSSLTSSKLASEVHTVALKKVLDTYGDICKAVKSPENKYEAANTLLASERPFGRVDLLGQIFGLTQD